MTENILLQKLSQGDEFSFSRVFELYWDGLLRYVVSVLKDKDNDVDVVQDTFAALWQQRDKLSHIRSLKCYLFSISHYKAIRYIQSNIRRNNYRASLADFLEIRESYLEERLYVRELTSLIEQEVKRLPPRMQEIFILSRMEYLTNKEIAERLEISDKTVKKQIGYSIKYLRPKIERQYLSSLLVLFFVSSLFSCRMFY